MTHFVVTYSLYVTLRNVMVLNFFNNRIFLTINCKYWYIDSNYLLSPRIFHRLYTIQNRNVSPSIAVLLPNKTEGTSMYVCSK